MSRLNPAIISTKVRVDLLGCAFELVLNRSYKNLEIVVVNDAFGDGTAELMQTYKKNRICC